MLRCSSFGLMLTLPCWLAIGITAVCPANATTKLFILAGQSNASGQADASQLPDELKFQGGISYWFDTDQGNSGNQFFRGLRNLGGKFGPEIRAGQILKDQLTDEIAFVKVSVGGTTLTPISGIDWSPSSTNELYDKLISNVIAARDTLIAAGKQVELAALFWMQGESDAKSGGGGAAPPPQPSSADAYKANLTDFILQARTDLSTPQLPFLIGRIKIGDNVSDFSTAFGDLDYTPTIQDAQAAVASSDPNNYLIDTSEFELGFDRIHFNYDGQFDLGEAFANQYLAIVPEPSTGIMLTLAMIALLLRRDMPGPNFSGLLS